MKEELSEGEIKRREGISKSMKGNSNSRKGKLNKTETFAGIRVDPYQLKILNKNYKLSEDDCQSAFLINLGLKG
ncbi:MAG: hypothetical protein GY870_09535 [archaeon]|nr:hypothetical protein [archaeon]